MTVLVTGATGFVGQAVVRYLAGQGREVRAAARNPDRVEKHPLVTPVPMPDLGGPLDWRDTLAGTRQIVHAAGLAHQQPGMADNMLMRVNADASGLLARAAATAGIERFILISSIRALSGPSASQVLYPDDTPSPTEPYGRSRLAAEVAVRAALVDAVVLRPPLVHGAGAKGNMARLARLALSPLPLPIGGLIGRRSIVSDFNLASAVAHLLDAHDARGGVFHIQDGPPLTVPEMISVMRMSLGRWPMIMTPPVALDAMLIRALAPRLAAQLADDLIIADEALRRSGWQPVESSGSGLARTVRAARTGQTRL
jgi:UDP-glucose 4-epimerase